MSTLKLHKCVWFIDRISHELDVEAVNKLFIQEGNLILCAMLKQIFMSLQHLILHLCLGAPLCFIWGIFHIPCELQMTNDPGSPGSSPVSARWQGKAEGVTNCPVPLSGSGLAPTLWRSWDSPLRAIGVYEVLASPGPSRATSAHVPACLSWQRLMGCSIFWIGWDGGCFAPVSGVKPEACLLPSMLC